MPIYQEAFLRKIVPVCFSLLSVCSVAKAEPAQTFSPQNLNFPLSGATSTVEVKLSVSEIKEVPALNTAILVKPVYVFSENVGYGLAVNPYFSRQMDNKDYAAVSAHSKVCQDAGYGPAKTWAKPTFIDESTGYGQNNPQRLLSYYPFVMGVNKDGALTVYKNDIYGVPRTGEIQYNDIHLNDWSPGYVNITFRLPSYVYFATWDEIHCSMK